MDMECPDELSKLFFELSSESRLGILREVRVKPLRMQEVARKLDLTDTEAIRQLRRLSEAFMISRQPDGKYSLTNYGEFLLSFIPPMEFALKHKQYLIGHDVFCLPYELINRLGELSTGEFTGEAMRDFNRVRKMAVEAEEYIWAAAEEVETSHPPITNEKVSKGVKVKVLLQKDFLRKFTIDKEVELLKERRYLERLNFSLFITEKEAVLCLRRHNGEMDYAGIFGTCEKFRKWTRDLFTYYWEKAERWYPNIKIE